MIYRKIAAIFALIAIMASCVPVISAAENPAPRIEIPESIEIGKGEEYALEPEFVPPESEEPITWTSSDKSIAAVTKKGVVRAKKAGQCVITAATISGLEARCSVTVTVPVKSVKLNKTSAEIGLNRTLQLTATVSPGKASDKTVLWKSSDESVAVVDENGLVTAVGRGKATITARSVNGKKAKCSLTVKNIKPTGIKMDELFVTMNPGGEYRITAKIKPAGASDTGIIYKSSDADVAEVDENGLVTAIAPGRATITLAASGKKSVKDTMEICVVEPGSGRLAGLVVGINPGHQTKTITKKYPIAPGSKEKAYGCKVGATGRFTRVPEYETNLQIGLMLSEMLSDAGATVVITRTSNDVSITNIDRARMLNKAGVDIAIHLHCNSSSYESKEGLSVYRKTTGKWQDEEKTMAKALADAMSAATGAVNLGVKTYNGYMSLNWSTTPAVLLEMGYISNRREDKLLASKAYRRKMAEGITEGIAQYFGR